MIRIAIESEQWSDEQLTRLALLLRSFFPATDLTHHAELLLQADDPSDRQRVFDSFVSILDDPEFQFLPREEWNERVKLS